MRIPSPASRAARRLRLYGFDLLWATVSPLLALYLSAAYVLEFENNGLEAVGLYCLVSAGCSIVSLLIFEVESSVPRYFSVHDAINICKAVLLSEIFSSWMLFSLTRLEGIPRSTPIVHTLIFAAGLIGVRACVRLFRGETIARHKVCSPKCILVVG
jgi:FlaA1/EpsC-like NDP-sugar epimerase